MTAEPNTNFPFPEKPWPEKLAEYQARWGHPAGTVTGGNPGHAANHRILTETWQSNAEGRGGVVVDERWGRWTFEEIHAHHRTLHAQVQPHPVWCWAPIGVEVEPR